MGTATITDTREAQARFDLVLAQEIAAQNDLRVKKLALDQLVGRQDVKPLPLATPASTPAIQPESAEAWVSRALEGHPAIVAATRARDIAQLETRKADAGHKPTLDLVGQYQVSRGPSSTGTPPGQFRTNTASVGLQFNLPLYTGGNISRQIETAKIAAQQAAVRTEALQRNLENALDQQLAQFQTQQKSLELESGNTESARESLRVSTERFRLGQTTALEVQNAQNVLEQVLLRRNLAQLNLKIAEIQLRILENNL